MKKLTYISITNVIAIIVVMIRHLDVTERHKRKSKYSYS